MRRLAWRVCLGVLLCASGCSRSGWELGGRRLGSPPTAAGRAEASSIGVAGAAREPVNLDLVCRETGEVDAIDKLDLLLVVDDSNSMREEQEALRRELPALVRTVASGVRRDGSTFPPARDLHLAVVSTDLGVPGVEGVHGCEGLGDDGRMANVPDATLPGCSREPFQAPFLSYQVGDAPPDDIAHELGCIASLGTDGCGYEQQLEAALKALWPAVDIDPETGSQWVDPESGVPGNRVTFLGDRTGAGRTGHGDGENAGFLRKDPAEGISLLAVLLVTDEDDCSSSTTDHLVPRRNLPVGSPYEGQGQNLRCLFNPDNLYTLDRYVEGFQRLRPGYGELVVFAAIVGVPEDLVAPEVLADVDFSDADSREAFYAAILDDPRMETRVDPETQADGEVDSDNLVPSCGGDGASGGVAYPPRRIVELARRFGQNGIVQSICQESFELALGAITQVISEGLDRYCTPR